MQTKNINQSKSAYKPGILAHMNACIRLDNGAVTHLCISQMYLYVCTYTVYTHYHCVLFYFSLPFCSYPFYLCGFIHFKLSAIMFRCAYVKWIWHYLNGWIVDSNNFGLWLIYSRIFCHKLFYERQTPFKMSV